LAIAFRARIPQNAMSIRDYRLIGLRDGGEAQLTLLFQCTLVFDGGTLCASHDAGTAMIQAQPSRGRIQCRLRRRTWIYWWKLRET
jgi:hypothetical protein